MSSSKPMNDLPNTIGEALDKRRTVENRIAKRYVESSTSDWDVSCPAPSSTFCFWKKGSCKMSDARSLVQEVLDRYAVLTELNEVTAAVNCIKRTDVTVPAFVPSMKETRLTLAQLRDANKFLLPHLIALEKHLTSQATQTKRQLDSHNLSVRTALERKIAELKAAYEAKVKESEKFEDQAPSKEDLEADIEREKARSDTKIGHLVDPVGIRQLISSLRAFNKMLSEEQNIIIDSVNSAEMKDEISVLEHVREKALNRMNEGNPYEIVDNPDEGRLSLSLAELESRMKSLIEDTEKAIPSLRIVTLTLSKNGKNEHDVTHASDHLAEVFYNVSAVLEYCQAHHVAMTMEFTAVHPLTQKPLSVDGFVRLGYLDDTSAGSRTSYGRRRKVTSGPKITLRHGLEELYNAITKVEQEVASSKEEHEAKIKASISDKQDARAKSGATMRPNEMDEIAKSMRAADATEWSIAPNLSEALDRVTKLRSEVESLQSAGRKSANATIRVEVPKPASFLWMNSYDDLAGW